MNRRLTGWVGRLPLLIGVAVLLLIVLELGANAALRFVVERELHPALPKGTQIDSIRLNLLRGSLQVEGFALQNDGETRIRADLIDLNVATPALFRGRIEVEAVGVKDAYLLVERRPDGRFDLGLPDFGQGAGDASAEGPPMAFSLDAVRVEDLVIDYRDGGQRSRVEIAELATGRYDLAAAEQVVPVTWRLTWDEQAIGGDLEIAIDAAGVGIDGRLRTDLIDLGRAQRLARVDPQVLGSLGFDGRVAWRDATVQLAGELQAPALDYPVAGRDVSIRGLQLPAFDLEASWAPTVAAVLDLPRPIRADSWSWAAEGQRATGRQVEVSGRLELTDANSAVVDGWRMNAAGLRWEQGARSAELDRLQASGRLQQDLSGTAPLPEMALDVAADGVRYVDGDAAIEAVVGQLAGEQLALSARPDDGRRDLAGVLRLASVDVTQDVQRVVVGALATTLGGTVSVDEPGPVLALSVDDIEVDSPGLPHERLTLGGLEVDGLELAGPYTVAGVRLRDLALPGGLETTALRVAGIAVGPSVVDLDAGIAVGEVVVDGLETGVVRDGEGVWQHVATPAARPAGDGSSPAAEPDAETAAEPLPWRLAGLRVTGDSHLTVADTLNPDMQPIRYGLERVEVGALDSAEPGADTPFDLLLRPDRYSEFAIAGVVRPLADDLYLDATGHLQGFGLTSVNGLIANDLGHRFNSGQLDNEFKIQVVEKHLEMDNQLALASVEAEALPDKDGPPLGTAIALLEDRDGNIKLGVPVSGDLDDPNFRVLGALDPIIMKAVAGAAALAIQPLGSVLLVGTLLADQALKVTFDPAVFEPASTALTDDARDYLVALAGKLVAKPKLGVRLCGIYAAVEREKDKDGKFVDDPEALLEIAQRRAYRVRDFMLEQGVGAQQLKACRPSLDDSEEGLPRVAIRF
jgi:hypothetical protein